MKFFKANDEKSVQRDIDAANTNRARLAAQLTEFEQAVTRHEAEAKQAARQGNDAELDRSEAALRASQDRTKSLTAALSDIDKELADLECKKAEIADRKARAEVAAEIEQLVRSMQEAGTAFDQAAKALAESTRKAAPIVFEAQGADNFMKACVGELPATLELTCTLLRAHANAVVAGTAPAKLPQPDDGIPKVLPPAPPPREPHFKYEAIKRRPFVL